MTDQTKITPPTDLEGALRAALSDLGYHHEVVVAESVLYTAPMQEWLHENLGDRGATEPFVDARDEEAITVECCVTVPVNSPPAAAAALSRVPINATIVMEDVKGLASVFGGRVLLAKWTEKR